LSIDDYSRLTITEDNNNRKYSNDNTVNTIPSENPLTTRNSYHSSSSYETKYRNTTSNPNNPDREQYHSREASPATTPNRNRSPSPPSGYIASSTTRTIPTTYGVGLARDPTSPSSTYVPQHEYYNVSFLFTVYKIFYFLEIFRFTHHQIMISMIDIHHHRNLTIEHHWV